MIEPCLPNLSPSRPMSVSSSCMREGREVPILLRNMHGRVQLFPGEKSSFCCRLSPADGRELAHAGAAAAAARRSCGQMGALSRSHFFNPGRDSALMALCTPPPSIDGVAGGLAPAKSPGEYLPGLSAKGRGLSRPAEPSFTARHVREFSHRIAFFFFFSAMGQSMRLKRSLARSVPVTMSRFTTPCPALTLA
jgi:hypothetical protein